MFYISSTDSGWQKVSTAVIESAIAVHAERVLAIGGAGTLLTN